MNIFAGIGKICEVHLNSKVLKFTLSVKQEKPCLVPCVLFDTSDDVVRFLEKLQSSGKTIWLQGRIASYEFEYNGKTIRKVEIVSHPRNIKPI